VPGKHVVTEINHAIEAQRVLSVECKEVLPGG